MSSDEMEFMKKLFTRHLLFIHAKGLPDSFSSLGTRTPGAHMRPSKTFTLIIASAIGLLVAIPQSVASAHSDDAAVFTLAVYGDSPYGLNNTDTSQLALTPQFIAEVNADPDVSGVLDVGDIHSGKSFCTVDYDNQIAALWSTFEDPLVYTPGDNEWSDCHKPAEGGGKFNATTGVIDFVANGSYAQGNPADNLALVRSTFFAKPGRALGSGKLKVTSQAKDYDRHFPTDKNYVENVRWEQHDIVFVTMNIPGGSNNDDDNWYGTPNKSQAQIDEIAQRTAADIRWLDAAFEYAEDEHAHAVVIMEQADMWDLDGKDPSHIANYEPFIASIATNTVSFGKPVLLLNGDSHIYRSDNPLSATAPCITESSAGEVACTTNLGLHQQFLGVENFHRIVVHGSISPLEWLKLSISDEHEHHTSANPNSFGPFSWTRMNTGLVGAS